MFDRQFNRIEKFNGRKLSDPDNHERRERRMVERKNTRWNENYTFFFGGLTEEEQQYRDYFETDFNEDPDDEFIENMADLREIAAEGQFNPVKYDFVDTSLFNEIHENYEDLVEDKIFKYKYRQMADDPSTFNRRMQRVLNRFWDRAENRDAPDIYATYKKDQIEASVAQYALDP